MVKKPTVLIPTPLPGYLIAEPFVEAGVFKPAKEQDGLDQTSKVLKISSGVIDNHNNLRSCPVQEGQVIHHAYSNKEVEINFKKYRYIHFSECHGIVK